MSKITLIGGGSYAWGPVFLRDILTTPTLAGARLCLHDIHAERMEQVYRLGRKMITDFGLNAALERTLSLDDALSGADVIIITITTGGLDAMRADLDIPQKFGIRHAVGDTVGPAGLSRVLRNVPIMAGIARKVDEICPDAFVLNYTNNMSILTRALDAFRTTPNRTVGLCHEWHGVRAKLAALFSVPPERVQAVIAGINHLPWALDLWIDGRNAWGDLPALAERILSGECDPDADDASPFADHCRVKMRLFQIYGALPVAGDRHVSEFFGNILTAENDWGARYGVALTSVDYREGMQAFERQMIESALSGETPLAPFMQEKSGEAASEIITALVTGGRYTGILNLPNSGQIDNLPRSAVVETLGTIDATGAFAHAIGDVPPGVQSVLERHIRNQEMLFDAALTGDRALALQALLNDPMSAHLDTATATSLLDALLEANRAYLPQFFQV